MGQLWLPGNFDVPAVHDGEPGADVPDRDDHVHHAVSGLQSCGAACDSEEFVFQKLDLLLGSCKRELISSGRSAAISERSAMRADRSAMRAAWSAARAE